MSADAPRAIDRIEPATEADIHAIAALLESAQLPHADFARHIRTFLVARLGGEVVGAIGAEVYGSDALLRSFAVRTTMRRQGLGDALLGALEHAGAGWGVRHWWLLATSAEAFFQKRGFRAISRAEAPESIAATEEFRGLCPSVAACLARERKDG